MGAPEVDDDDDAAASRSGSASHFIKRPPFGKFHDYQEGNAVHLIPETLLREAYALQAVAYTATTRQDSEAAAAAPPTAHPNIVAFYGCRVRRGRITGLVLDAHGQGDLRKIVRAG